MPYCKSKDGKYHVISRHCLPLLLKSITEEARIVKEGDSDCYNPRCELTNAYKNFELSIRSKIDKCPVCKSNIFPVSLICCSKNGNTELMHPDFLDYEEVKHNVVIPAYIECTDCKKHELFDYNYNNCSDESIECKYQCRECGAVFDSETNEIVTGFDSSQVDEIYELP